MDRPNILVIMTDQQHHRMLSCAGNPWLRTPNMDRIATAGTRFDRAYCTDPVCVPSRFSMMTGRMPTDIGMRKNGGVKERLPDEVHEAAWGHLLREAGYETAYGGKVHCPGQLTAESMGFEYLTKDERDRLAIEAAAFIRREHDKPWALVASFINPHDICHLAIKAHPVSDFEKALLRNGSVAIKEMEDALAEMASWDEEEFFERICPPLPPNFDPQADEPEVISTWLQERQFKQWVRDNWGEREWRVHRWVYHRLTERADAQIGVVLDALAASGQWDTTLIVFTSDHGDHNGSHRLEHKTVFYDEAARVPLLVTAPGQQRASVVDEDHLVSTGLDLLPTVCDYAGARVPEHCFGRSLRPVLEGRAEDWREGVYAVNQHSRMWVEKERKYVRYDFGDNPEQLYDLIADPHETRNHIDQPAHAPHVQRMRARLEAERERHDRYLVGPALQA